MQSSADVMIVAKAKTFFVVLCAAVVACSLSTTHRTQALVEVMICPEASQSHISIASPQSDSIVNQPKVEVRGNVTFVSQIDFFIDDAYNNTEALEYSATTFSSTVTLDPGTHTIKLMATDSCSQATYTDSVVVTYEPTTQPSVGENVDTVVEGSSSEVSDENTPAIESNGLQTLIDDFIVPPFTYISDALDISHPTDAPADVVPGDVARSALFVAGTVLTLAAVQIGMAATLPAQLSFMFNHRRLSRGVLMTVGLALISLVFIL